jgi:hypothetical protein
MYRLWNVAGNALRSLVACVPTHNLHRVRGTGFMEGAFTAGARLDPPPSRREQPEIGQWNVVQLARALVAAGLLTEEEAGPALAAYSETLTEVGGCGGLLACAVESEGSRGGGEG